MRADVNEYWCQVWRKPFKEICRGWYLHAIWHWSDIGMKKLSVTTSESSLLQAMDPSVELRYRKHQKTWEAMELHGTVRGTESTERGRRNVHSKFVQAASDRLHETLPFAPFQSRNWQSFIEFHHVSLEICWNFLLELLESQTCYVILSPWGHRSCQTRRRRGFMKFWNFANSNGCVGKFRIHLLHLLVLSCLA